MAGLPRERVTESVRIYEGRVTSLRVDTVDLGEGRPAIREVVEHADVVAIVPLLENGDVLLVRQYRLAVEEELLEVPAGGVDEGEMPERAAQRELGEECGRRASRLERLGGFYASPGFCTEFIHVFLATGLEPQPSEPDPDETLEVDRVSLEEALRLVERGEIKDAKSIIGLLWAARKVRVLHD